MWLRSEFVLSTLLVAHVLPSSQAFRGVPTYRPNGVALGHAPCSDVQKFQAFSLTSSNPVATLDYGAEVAGYPTFEVAQTDGRVHIEVKYSEEFHAVGSNFSDGPWPYAVALANTYRVETFEIKNSGCFNSSLLQGGQRWQSIRLLTSGSVTFSAVGFEASVPVTDIDKLPGGFMCSDESLNKIWKLGARAVGLSCFEKASQKKMWVVNEDGAFVRGMRSGISAEGAFFENYTLEFDGRIERAGFGWVVAHPLASPAKGIQLNLVGSLPANTTFANTNTSLTPPNSVILGYGYSFVNQTTLTSYVLDTFDVPFSVQEGTWYRIKTVLSKGEYVAVFIGGRQIFNVSTKSYFVGMSPFPGVRASISLRGSFGFGGWQDQAGRFRNAIVYDSKNRSVLYKNSMVDEEQVLAEYGVHGNYASVCLDGPKRDRLVWLGDFLHTVRIIGASISRMDLAKGTLQFLLDWQIPSGLLPYAPPIGYNASVASDAYAIGGGDYLAGYEVASIILPDYQILGILSFTNYVYLTNDIEFARRTWPAWKLNIGWVLIQIDSAMGLLSLIGAFLGPADKGSAINCALVEALNGMSDVAYVLGDAEAYLKYRSVAVDLVDAINKNLWVEKTGIYSISPSLPEAFSINSVAFCITSGTANATQAGRLLTTLPSLKLGPGYKDSTLVNGTDPSTNISPNTNGFLLSALLSQPDGAQPSWELLQNLWPKMLNDKKTTTGASWEYVSVQGKPGLGFFTSLSHPWGGAPTYLLIEWVVGIQPVKGIDGFGYRNWVVNPNVGIRFGLKRAQGRVSTTFGQLEAEWKITGGKMHVMITAPETTQGTFQLGQVTRVLRGGKEYKFEVELPL